MKWLMVAFAVLITSPGWASNNGDGDEESKRTFLTFGPRASYFNPRNGDSVWMGGAQLRIFPSPVVALEGSVDYRREDRDPVKIDVFPVQASFIGYVLPGKHVNIVAIGGAGWYFTRIDSPPPIMDETENRFGLHVGGGVELQLNRYWSLDSSYRYIWIDRFNSVDKNLRSREFNDSGDQVTIGLNYHF